MLTGASSICNVDVCSVYVFTIHDWSVIWVGLCVAQTVLSKDG